MNLTVKKLIKLILDDKKMLVISLIVSSLFYPMYFSILKSKKVEFYNIDFMYNYTIPNSISSLLTDTFFNSIYYKIVQNEFINDGFDCAIKLNENYRSKTIECKDENKNPDFENFRKKINSLYEKHIDNFYKSMTLSPFSISDKTELIDLSKNYLSYIITEKEKKFFLVISQKEKKNKFNIIYYITSFILIFFLNIFRILIKY